MPPSAKEIRDLQKFAPAVLREPSTEPLERGAKPALMRWAVASGLGPVHTVMWTFGNPKTDQTFGFAIVGNVCGMALHLNSLTEVERQRTLKIAAAERGKPMPPHAKYDRRLAFRSDLEKPEDLHPLLRELGTKAQEEGMRIFVELRSLNARKRVLESQLAETVAALEAAQENLVVPYVASGYLTDPRRDETVAEETCFLAHLRDWDIPLLRAIAMIGGLRNGRVAVDVEHEALDTIYATHAKNLQRLRAKLRKVADRSTPLPSDLSVGKKGRRRQNGSHAASRARKKR